jgi:hypothetical protein
MRNLGASEPSGFFSILQPTASDPSIPKRFTHIPLPETSRAYKKTQGIAWVALAVGYTGFSNKRDGCYPMIRIGMAKGLRRLHTAINLYPYNTTKNNGPE